MTHSVQKGFVVASSLAAMVFCASVFSTPNGWLYAHMLSIGLGLILALTQIRSSSRNTTSLLSSALFIFLGPFGAATSLIMLLTILFSGNRSSELNWLMEPEVEIKNVQQQEIHDRLSGLRKHSRRGTFVSDGPIVPFLDTIRFGTEPEKQLALGQIGRNYSFDFAPALRAGLEDPAGLIRVQVGSTIAAIDERSRKTETENGTNQERAQKVIERLSTAKHTTTKALVPLRRNRFGAKKRKISESDAQVPLPTPLECRILVEDLIREKKFEEARKILRSLMRGEARRTEATQNLVCRFLFARKSFSGLRRYMAWVARPVPLASVVRPSARSAANE